MVQGFALWDVRTGGQAWQRQTLRAESAHDVWQDAVDDGWNTNKARKRLGINTGGVITEPNAEKK